MTEQKKPIDPKSITATTSVGIAAKVGAAQMKEREKAKGRKGDKRFSNRMSLAIALAVIAVLVGTLLLMLRTAP